MHITTIDALNDPLNVIRVYCSVSADTFFLCYNQYLHQSHSQFGCLTLSLLEGRGSLLEFECSSALKQITKDIRQCIPTLLTVIIQVVGEKSELFGAFYSHCKQQAVYLCKKSNYNINRPNKVSAVHTDTNASSILFIYIQNTLMHITIPHNIQMDFVTHL